MFDECEQTEMFWIALPDGSTRRSKMLRISLASAYLLMGVGGLFLVISPMFREVYSWRIEIMACFLMIGGLLGFVGAISKRWFGEFTGLPLLASSFAVFGLVTLGDQSSVSLTLAWGNAFLLWSMAAMLTARWRVSFAYYKLAMTLGSVDE